MCVDKQQHHSMYMYLHPENHPCLNLGKNHYFKLNHHSGDGETAGRNIDFVVSGPTLSAQLSTAKLN